MQSIHRACCFTLDDFARGVLARMVQVRDGSGTRIAEVKGTILEIEVYPGQRSEWWLVPLKTRRYNDLKCTIEGHAEGGMVGTIVIH